MILLGVVAVDGRPSEGMGHFKPETAVSVLFDVGFDVADHRLRYAVLYKHGAGFGGSVQMEHAGAFRSLKGSVCRCREFPPFFKTQGQQRLFNLAVGECGVQ